MNIYHKGNLQTQFLIEMTYRWYMLKSMIFNWQFFQGSINVLSFQRIYAML